MLLVAGWFWSLLGFALIVVSRWGIESILVTGPVLELIGITALAFAMAGKSLAAIIAAVGPVLFPVAIFALIFFLRWGPGVAREPVTYLVAAFLLVFPVTILVAWTKR